MKVFDIWTVCEHGSIFRGTTKGKTEAEALQSFADEYWFKKLFNLETREYLGDKIILKPSSGFHLRREPIPLHHRSIS